MRKDDLDVGLGTKGARLEERLGVVHAAGIHVLACVRGEDGQRRRTEGEGATLTSSDVVEGIRDAVNVVKELVAKNTYEEEKGEPSGSDFGGRKQRTLGLSSNSQLEDLDLALELLVHLRDRPSSSLTLEASDVFGAEEELPVEVGLLDGVEVGHVDVTLLARSQSHHGPVLEHLATDGSRADEELALVLNLGLEGATEDGDLSVVAGRRGGRGAVGSGRLHVGKGLEGVEVEVLVEGAELAGAGLEDLLADESSHEGVDGREIASSLVRELGEDLLVEITLVLGLGGDILGERNESRGVLVVAGSREAGVGGAEGGESLETDVEGGRAIPLGEIGDEELGREDRLLEGFLWCEKGQSEIREQVLHISTYEVDELGQLDLVEPSSALVLAEAASVADGEGVGPLREKVSTSVTMSVLQSRTHP